MRSIQRLLFPAFFLLILLGSGKEARASHGQGMDLTYECLGNDQYEVTLSFYRFCDGISAPTSPDLDVESDSCDIQFSEPLTQIAGTGIDITPVCSTQTTTCDNSNASVSGVEEYVYQGVITLPDSCEDWVLSYGEGVRNNDITTIDPTNVDIYVEAHIDNLNFPCNSSPVFNNPPVPYVCEGDTFCFSQGATDPEGDSLAFSLVTPTTNENSTVSYLPGYTATQPLSSSPPVTIDTGNGDICVAPTNQNEVTVLQVRVEEWRDSNMIGLVNRDVQMRVRDCPDTNSLPELAGVDSTFMFSTTVCEGDSVNFDIPSLDPDSNQHVDISWDGGIPGGVFDPGSGSRPVANFQWETDSTHAGGTYCFSATVKDNFCPIVGTQSYTFCVNVAVKDSILKNLDIDYGSGTFCYDQDSVTPTITGDTTGTFHSIPAGLDIDTSTGTVDISNSPVGQTFTIAYQTSDTLLCQGQDSVPFTIENNSVPDFHYADTSYCETAAQVQPTFLNGGTHGNFWTDDTGSLEVDSAWGTVFIQDSDTGTYTVYNHIPANGSCPDSLDSATIIIEPQPHVDAGPNATICEGDVYTMQGSYWRGASAATWTSSGDGTFDDPTDTSTNYTHGPGDVGSGSFENVLTSDSIEACNVDRDTMTLNVKQAPSLSVSGTDTICADGSADVSASITGNATGVNWSTGGDGFFDDVSATSTVYHPGDADVDSGTVKLYAVTVGSGVCANVEDSMEVTVLPLADPSFHYDTTEICIQDQGDIVATVDGESGGVFTADPPGGLDLDSNTGKIDLSESYADNFFVTYTVGDRCPNDTTVEVMINPTPGTPHPNTFEVCPDRTDTLSVGGNPDSAVWYGDQEESEVLGTGVEYVPPVEDFETPGEYTYYVRKFQDGCVSPLGAGTVTSHPNADVRVSTVPDPPQGVRIFELALSNESDQNVVDYEWGFGNGNQASDFIWNDTTVVYEEKGEYIITLNARDSSTGCFGSTQLEVEVLLEPRAQLPNVFTPNSDGQNDEFKPRLENCPEEAGNGSSSGNGEEEGTCWSGIRTFTGTIYNRWGNEVYRWSDWNNAWDGGKSPEGTYFYTIEATGENGEKVEYKGKVTLLRDGG